MKNRIPLKSAAFVIALFCAFVTSAQIVTTSPVILQQSSPDVVLTYDAASSAGNRGLAGLPASEPVYAHIGVITNLSKDWAHIVTPWPEQDGSNAESANTTKNRLTRVADNTYTLTIGDMRTYFGVTDPNETIERIAIVFRNADGTRTGKTASDGDIYVDVLPDGFAMTLTSDATSTVISAPTAITFTVNTTAASDITLSVNDKSIATASAATRLEKAYEFASKGSYRVTATAVSGGKTYTESMSVTWPEPSSAKDYPGGVPVQGAVTNADGSVTFCLAAPGKQSVALIGDWTGYELNDASVMYYQDYQGNRYFHTTVTGINDGKYHPYYYLVDGQTAVGDPYARLVLDPYSDKWLDSSIWPDMPRYPYERFDNIVMAAYRNGADDYDWSAFTIPAPETLVVYEMLLRDFTGTDGEANGNGTIAQAIERLPYLKALGVNAVELMPIMEFNGNNSWGYNTNFYFAPDKAYGSPDDYRRFIDLCHQNGMAVILDIVFNQSDGLHPWYQMYPVGSNPFYNAVAPHAYSVLNDWNQGGNPLVEQQWSDALRYWLTAYNVDGFRFDLVKGLGDNDSYGNGTDGYNQSRIDRMKRLHAVIKSVKPDAIHINEDLAGPAEEKALAADGMLQWANINRASGRLTSGWNDGETGISGTLTGGQPVSAFLSSLDGGRPWGSTVAYAESHDEQRLGFYNLNNGKNERIRSNPDLSASRLGALAVEMLMTPGPKMIWQFGELGASQSTKNDDGGNNTDPKTVLWSTLSQPQIKALHDSYQAMCCLRRDNPDLFTQSATFETSNIDDVLSMPRAMRLRAGDKEVIALVNTSITTMAKTVTLPVEVINASNSRLLCASPLYKGTLSVSGSTASASVAAGAYAVYISDAVTSGIDDIMTDAVTDDADAADPRWYNLQGISLGEERPTAAGLYINRGRKVLVK